AFALDALGLRAKAPISIKVAPGGTSRFLTTSEFLLQETDGKRVMVEQMATAAAAAADYDKGYQEAQAKGGQVLKSFLEWRGHANWAAPAALISLRNVVDG